jgi:hypothetical protein
MFNDTTQNINPILNVTVNKVTVLCKGAVLQTIHGQEEHMFWYTELQIM